MQMGQSMQLGGPTPSMGSGSFKGMGKGAPMDSASTFYDGRPSSPPRTMPNMTMPPQGMLPPSMDSISPSFRTMPPSSGMMPPQMGMMPPQMGMIPPTAGANSPRDGGRRKGISV